MSARRRSQTQSASQKNIAHRTDTSSNPSLQTKATPAKANPVAAAMPVQAARTPSTKTPSTQNRRPTIRTSEQAPSQQAVVMGPPATPAAKTETPSRPQRQSKVDALAKKVWNTVAPRVGRKRANPAAADPSASKDPSSTVNNSESDALPDAQPPASKKRKGPVDVNKVGAAPLPSQQQAVAPTPSNRRASAGGNRNTKTTPRVQVSVDSDSSAVESDDDVPLKQRQTAAMSEPSTGGQPGVAASQKPLTRGARTGPAQAKARVESEAAHNTAQEVADVVVESDASNSADEYTPDEDDEAFSEEDELDDPLSEDLEELEAQLREEAPVWTKEKNDKLPPVLRRKQTKKAEDQVDFKRMMELAEEQVRNAGKSERSTSKASQRRQLEQPVWKAPQSESAHPDDVEDGMEPWTPVKYYIPAPDDPHWEENRGTAAADDSDEPLIDDGNAAIHAQAYEIKPPTTPGGVLSLKEQDSHIQDMIRHTFQRVESNLVFENGFPDAVGRARFVYEAMRDCAKELGYEELYQQLAKDTSFARHLASLPNQRISTFRSNIKKQTDHGSFAFYGLAPGEAEEMVDWYFEHLKYIYPLVHTPADKRTVTWAKPYQNPAVVSTLRACFFTGAAAIGNRDVDRFVSSRSDREDEQEIPMPMLALVGAALHASLSEWKTGQHKKGTFSADAFLDAYNEHVTLLTGIKTQNPRAYHTMMHRLYCEASGVIAPAANLASASDALAHVDFAGMEVD